MPNLRLSEPLLQRYVYISPANVVHLMVPITGGVRIGADNTCKTVLALQEFFGKRSDSNQLENSARHGLIRYRRALEDDIQTLSAVITQDQSPESKAKRDNLELVEDRLKQVKQLIDILSRVEMHPSLSGLSGGYPAYPQAFKDLLGSAESNIYSMRLRPLAIDNMLNAQNPVFSLNRTSNSNTLYHALRATFSSISKVSFLTHVDFLEQQVMKKLEPKFPVVLKDLISDVSQALASTYNQLFGKTLDFPINDEVVSQAGYELDEQIEDKEQLEAFVGMVIKLKHSSIFPVESPFTKLTSPIVVEQLNVMTQFFLAEMNFHAKAKGYSQKNFGQLLDADTAIATALANVVKQALQKSLNVEREISNFINTKAAFFGLSQNYSNEDMVEIAQNFASDYATIEKTEHFDEFMVLQNKPGSFFTHQGSLCCDFSSLLSTPTFQFFDPAKHSARAKQELKTLPLQIPGRDPSTLSSTPLDEEKVKAMINVGIASNDYTIVRQNLLGVLDDGRRVFELLGRDFFAQFDSNLQAKNLFIQVRRAIPDATLSKEFNRVVRGQDAQLLLTPKLANALYVAAASRSLVPLSKVSQYSTKEAVEFLIKSLGITDTEITAGYNGNFVVDTSTAKVEQLQGFIDPYIPSDPLFEGFHLTMNIAKSLYKEVTQRYGQESPEYKEMETYNNQTFPPKKIIKALELLHINFPTTLENMMYPQQQKTGFYVGGYIIKKISQENLHTINGIHENQTNRFRLTSEMAGALYTTVCQKGGQHFEIILQSLSNDTNPNKLMAALMVLGIDYSRIEFNKPNGYFVYMNEVQQAKVKKIVKTILPEALDQYTQLTQEEERTLIPGYRIQVTHPDIKTQRGFLYEQLIANSRSMPRVPSALPVNRAPVQNRPVVAPAPAANIRTPIASSTPAANIRTPIASSTPAVNTRTSFTPPPIAVIPVAAEQVSNRVASVPSSSPTSEAEAPTSPAINPPSTDQDEIRLLIETLMRNIRVKTGGRQSWFNIGSENKVAKLESVLTWMEQPDVQFTSENRDKVLSLIHGICAQKRNFLGLFAPHSLNEFNTAIALKPPYNLINYTNLELSKIVNLASVEALINPSSATLGNRNGGF